MVPLASAEMPSWNLHSVLLLDDKSGLIALQAVIKCRKASLKCRKVFSEWEMACSNESHMWSLQ